MQGALHADLVVVKSPVVLKLHLHVSIHQQLHTRRNTLFDLNLLLDSPNGVCWLYIKADRRTFRCFYENLHLRAKQLRHVDWYFREERLLEAAILHQRVIHHKLLVCRNRCHKGLDLVCKRKSDDVAIKLLLQTIRDCLCVLIRIPLGILVMFLPVQGLLITLLFDEHVNSRRDDLGAEALT